MEDFAELSDAKLISVGRSSYQDFEEKSRTSKIPPQFSFVLEIVSEELDPRSIARGLLGLNFETDSEANSALRYADAIALILGSFQEETQAEEDILRAVGIAVMSEMPETAQRVEEAFSKGMAGKNVERFLEFFRTQDKLA